MYILGGVQLPQPKRLSRKLLERSVEHLLMFGTTTKNVTNRKEQYILNYVYLTPAQVGSILSLYDLQVPLIFECTDENMEINPTEVLVDITNRNYPPSGELWREDLQVVLTEVI